MKKISPSLPIRLSLGCYFLYSGLRKFESDAPSRMEPLVTRGYPFAVEAVGFSRLFAIVRLFELTAASGLLLGRHTRLAGLASAAFGTTLLVLLWRLPDTVHQGSCWRLTTKGMEHLKNVWIVGIGLSLAIGESNCRSQARTGS